MTSKSTTHIPMTPIKAYEVQINEGSPQKKSARFSGYCTSLSAHLKSSAQRIAKVAIAVIESPKAACALAVSSAAGLAASYYTGDTTGLFPLYLCVGLGVQRFLDTFPLLENANGELPLIENETPQSSASAFRRFTDHAIRTALYTERYLAYEIHALALDGIYAGIITPLVAPLLGVQISVLLTSAKHYLSNAEQGREAWQRVSDFFASQPAETRLQFLKHHLGEASLGLCILASAVTLSALVNADSISSDELICARNLACFLAGIMEGGFLAQSAFKLKLHAISSSSPLSKIVSKITMTAIEHPGAFLATIFAHPPSSAILTSTLLGVTAGLDFKRQTIRKYLDNTAKPFNLHQQPNTEKTALSVRTFCQQNWLRCLLTPGIVTSAYLASLTPALQPYTSALLTGLSQYYLKKIARAVHHNITLPENIRQAAKLYIDTSDKCQFASLSFATLVGVYMPFRGSLLVNWGVLGFFLGNYHDNFEQESDSKDQPQPSYAVGLSL